MTTTKEQDMAEVGRDEQERRSEELRQFRHSTEMEGGRLSDAVEHDLAQFVRGDVDEAELRRRVRERHGLSE